MAIYSSVTLTAYILVALVLFLIPFPSVAVPSEELESAMSVLRVRGRALFANAITTSDILFDLLSSESLTLLGPTDAMLYNLDVSMSYSLSLYISTLRLHALPLRLPISELRSLPNGSSIPTFVPSNNLLLTKLSSSDSVYLDGVQILLPGLFYGQHIAVHGLSDVLPLRSLNSELEKRTAALPPMVDSPEMSPSSILPLRSLNSELEKRAVALPPTVDSPEISPSPIVPLRSLSSELEKRTVALPPMVDSPEISPSPSSPWWLSPSPEADIEFFGREQAEPPQIVEASLSPADQLEEDLIVGDGDSWTKEF